MIAQGFLNRWSDVQVVSGAPHKTSCFQAESSTCCPHVGQHNRLQSEQRPLSRKHKTSTVPGAKSAPVEERFWSKVDRRGPDECWPWRAGTNKDGYGRFRQGGRGSPMRGAHCVAFEMATGVKLFGSGQVVMHACDNPPCCNPAHLSVGTYADNAADCAAKKRTKDQRGSKHSRTSLTEADVVAMREAFHGGVALKPLAAAYRIRVSTASYIVNGRTWTHVPMPAECRPRSCYRRSA